MKITSESYTTYVEAIEGSEDLMMGIPQEIIESEDWRAGDVLSMEVVRGGIVITNTSKSERERPKTKTAKLKRQELP